MPIRNMAIAISFFLMAVVLLAYKFDPSVRYVMLAFAFGLAAGSSLFAFAFGIASMASNAMQRHIAEQLIRQSPDMQRMYPTRVIPPVHMHVGKAEDVISRTYKPQ